WPLLGVGRLANTLERGNVSYTRIEELLAIHSQIEEVKEPVNQELKGDIHFNVRSFKYESDAEPTLKDVQFTLKSGQTLGLVGKTGSGKSTIFKLLMREYDHYNGSSMYGVYQLNTHLHDAVARGSGYVAQVPFLLAHYILENIRVGAPETSKEEVEKYARVADVDQHIMDTPEKFDT